jgi:hypothetical protein
MRIRALYLGIILAAGALTGCPSNLRFTAVEVSGTEAAPGERIRISWAYENDGELRRQTIQPFFLSAIGVVPGTLVELPVGTREHTFTFTAPTTVALIAENENGPTDGVALDFGLREDFELKATVRALDNREYPRLGYPTGENSYEIDFSQFVAFFDPPKDANGIIDEFSPVLGNDFFFRAFTSSPQETINNLGLGQFSFFQGAAYPLVVPTQPAISPQANAMVFGGALAYEGEPFPVKGPDDEFFARRGRGFTFEPIFMTMAFLIDFQSNPRDVQITEVTVGNLSQGLITPVVFGELIFSPPSSRFVDVQGATVNFVTDGSETDVMSGTLKAAQMGIPITTADGDIFDAFTSLENITWRMPFLFDNDLGDRVTFGPQAVR